MAIKKQNNISTKTTALNQQSLQFLGLTKQPFGSEILSDENFFNSPEVDKITESLIHQIQFSDLLLIVEGLQGSGKTCLFRQLIQADIQNIKLLSVQAEATDTLIQIQQKMSLHLQDLGDANHLDDNLKSLQMFDQTPLIIMDNSHVLSDITLQEFFRYQQQLKSEHDVNLKVLLFANTGMSETIKNITDIQDNKMYVQSMPVFSAQQASGFIFHRLKSAGYSGEPLFNETDIQALLKKLKATPANIMQNAAPAIDKIVRNQLTPKKGKFSATLLFLLLLIIIALAGTAYFYFFSTEKTTADVPAPDINEADIFIAEENTADNTQTEETLNELKPVETIPSEPELTTDSAITAPQLSTPAAKDLPVGGKNIHTPKPVKPPSLVTLPVEPPIEKTVEEVINEAVKENKEATPPVDKNITDPQPPQAVQVTKPITIPIPSKPAAQEIAAPVVTPAPTQSRVLKPEIKLHPALSQLNKLGVKDAAWIKKQPSSVWTLQLLGARDPSTLLKFARQHRLGARIAWYKTMLKGKPYYVLIHGSYPTRDIARASINKLSAQLRALKPWVKSMKSVQQAIQ